VEHLVIEENEIKGVLDQTGYFYGAAKVIITTGTFLNGLVHIGGSQCSSGRAGELASLALAACIKELGFETGG